MKGKVWDITDLTKLKEAIVEILAELKNVERSNCAVALSLSGDLGAGKTTFTQIMAEHLGVEENLTSPTFVIMKKYQTKDDCFAQLVHIDAYRLNSPEELSVLGFTSEILNKGNMVVVEWGEKVDSLLPPETLKLQFALDGGRRTLTKI